MLGISPKHFEKVQGASRADLERMVAQVANDPEAKAQFGGIHFVLAHQNPSVFGCVVDISLQALSHCYYAYRCGRHEYRDDHISAAHRPADHVP